jgi:uridine kinase
VEIPHFDFKTGLRVHGHKVTLPPNTPILIEGIHALNERLTSFIPKYQKFKIYISPLPQINLDDHNPINTTDLRLLRRIVRDFRYRNTEALKTLEMWHSVRRGEYKWIYPFQEEADFIFNSELGYEIGIMKKYALPLLYKIDPSSSHYIAANRLIKFLKYVKDIDDQYIPSNSILREFIGGSLFYHN